jgi:hypothetical protein
MHLLWVTGSELKQIHCTQNAILVTLMEVYGDKVISGDSTSVFHHGSRKTIT